LTLRIYAIADKNIPVVIGFAAITASQLVLGICLVDFAVRSGAQTPPPIPLDAYRLCVFVRHRKIEVAYTSISLLYDFLAFLFTFFLARLSKTDDSKVPGILSTVLQDATRYFLVIFTSHFVLEMTLILCQGTTQLLPANGNIVYISVMISRMMLSLRKVADLEQGGRSFGGPSVNGSDHPWGLVGGGQDGILLDTIPESVFTNE